MPNLALYPRGYVTLLKPMAVEESFDVLAQNGDAEVDRLYKIYLSRTINTQTWDYRKQVVATASRLFKNFEQWLRLQVVANDRINDLYLEFLKDTLMFIASGRRSMSVTTWQELLQDYPEPIVGSAHQRRFAETCSELDNIRTLLDNLEGVSIIGLWCSNENGVEDLMSTLNILFGRDHKAA